MNNLVLELSLPSSQHILLRSLASNDVQKLTMFLENLSAETRTQSTFPSYDALTAQEFCDAIGKYDKERFVVESASGEIVGLMEFSMDIPPTDVERFKKYNVELDAKTDCRFGPTLADSYQNLGVGSIIFPHVIGIPKKFDKKRVILYGGVLVTNVRAIRFYEKNGFRTLGSFINSDGNECQDMMLEL